MIKLTSAVIPSLDLGGSNTQTGISHFNSLQLIGTLDDEISNTEIVAKLETLRDEDVVECQNSSEARQHLKKLMSK